MKLIIDDANINTIKTMYEYFPIDGVTTNPSILAKNNQDPYETLKEIREFIGKKADLHVQVLAQDCESILEEASCILKTLGNNTYIKVPATREGLKAIKQLKAKGSNVTATAIYTSMQAFLSAKAGADYVAPYVNRIDNMGFDGIEVAKQIDDIFKNNGLHCQVLAASFKNSKQVLELAAYGIGAATISPDIIEGFLKIDATTQAVKNFTKDFETSFGSNKTMKL